MDTRAPVLVVACPTCGTLIVGLAGPGPACPGCGLPAAGHAGLVIARIESTLTEFRFDRDRLLDSLRLLASQARPAAPYAPAPSQANVSGPAMPAPGPGPFPHRTDRVPIVGRFSPYPGPAAPGPAVPPVAQIPPGRRLSPQQLLLATGTVLLVSAAIAFGALAWGSLGLLVQATTLVLLTALVCVASVVAARRQLRTTAEALACAGLALLVVDLVAARFKGLVGLDQLPFRGHAALTLGAVLVLGVVLHRVAGTTLAWSIGALVAAQPLAFLALPESARTPVPVVGVGLLVSAANVVVTRRAARSRLGGVATGFAGGWWVLATATGVVAAWSGSGLESVLCTLLVTAAGAAAVRYLPRVIAPRFAALLPSVDLIVGASSALALAGTLAQIGIVGDWLTGALGIAILTAALPLLVRSGRTAQGRQHAPPVGAPSPERARWLAPAALAAVLLGMVSVAALIAGRNWTELAGLTVVAAAGSTVVAVLERGSRGPAAALAACLPGLAVPLLVADGFQAQLGGWILAVLAACTLGVASTRTGQVEERPLAASATMLGLVAVTLTGTSFAWGQLSLQLVVTGAGLLAYGQAARRRPATLHGLANLVLASWVGAAGASVTTPEVYTVPAVLGLLLAAGQTLTTAPSWSVWGAPLLVGLLPSTLVVLDDPDPVRLILLVATATASAVLGTHTHRQAPFVIGLAVLATLAVTELGPYATLIPRWVSLGVAGVVLLGLGATYERRLAEAREAVAWVGSLR